MTATHEGEPYRLTDPDEVLLRQVHPDQVEGGGISKVPFLPRRGDNSMVSTLRGYVSPEEAYRRHTEDHGHESVGTWGVAVGEGEEHGVPSWDDSCLPESPADHASLDYAQHPAVNQRARVARKLRDAAVARGCLFAPAQTTATETA